MEYRNYTTEEIKVFVDSRLRDVVRDDEPRARMTDVFVRSVHGDKHFFNKLYNEKVECVAIDSFYQEGNYDALVGWGDSLLLFIGFFTEHLSKQRKAGLGLQHYVDQGIGCYDSAVNLNNEKRAKTIGTDPSLVNYFSDHFIELSGGYFRLHERMNESGNPLEKEVVAEVKRTLGIMPALYDRIIILGGAKRGKKKGLSGISRGTILDNNDLMYVPLDVLIEQSLARSEEEERKTLEKSTRPTYLQVVK